MARLSNLLPWRRRQLERDFDRELRDHIDRRVEELKGSGLTDGEARRRAVLELGGVAQVQEEVRDTWTWRWLENGNRDLRHAVRTLRRRPAFAATAMLSLALGIGANAALFSLVDQVLVRSLPVNDPERLVHLDWKGSSLANSWGSGNLMSYPLCRDFDNQREFFDGAFCRHPTTVNLSTGVQHHRVRAEIVSGSYFPVLGVRPAAGRLIDRSDDLQAGAHPVIVISYAHWQNQLGGAQDIVGRKVLINNHPMTVIGITAAGFPGVDPLNVPAVWIPAMMKAQATPDWDRLFDRRAVWMHVFARLKPEVTPDEAEAGVLPWFRSMLEEDSRLPGFPKVDEERRRNFLASSVNALPAARGLSLARGALERPLLVLAGGTIVLVVLASLNVAGLLLARGASRSRELATRMALGATRGRITGQLLVEGLLVALAGGALGLLIAPSFSEVLLAFLADGGHLSSRIDYRVFFLALTVSVATGALCGLVPAFSARRLSLNDAFKARTGGAGGGAAVRWRKTIVVAQLAFTLVLLIGAGLFVQTLARLRAKDLGFAASSLIMFSVNPPEVGYSNPDATLFISKLLRTFREIPSVERAAVANSSLLTGASFSRLLTIDADERIVTEESVPGLRVSPEFLSTLQARLVAGRDFTEADTHDYQKTGFRSVIVNESFARRYFGGRNPVGRRIGIGNQPTTKTSIEIVGMVEDFSFRSIRTDDKPEHVFYPFVQAGSLAADGTFYLRVRGTPEASFAAIRAAVTHAEPTLPVVELTTLDEQITRALRDERMLATLSSAFGVIALLLSVVGLYGVMSFVVTQRTPEIGVRVALGATSANAVWLITRETLMMIGGGIVIALPVVWALRRFVEAELFGVGAFDGPTVALASGLLVVVTLGAAMLPAWRAASVSPTEALRFD